MNWQPVCFEKTHARWMVRIKPAHDDPTRYGPGSVQGHHCEDGAPRQAWGLLYFSVALSASENSSSVRSSRSGVTDT
jgi:hypothetical protein